MALWTIKVRIAAYAVRAMLRDTDGRAITWNQYRYTLYVEKHRVRTRANCTEWTGDEESERLVWWGNTKDDLEWERRRSTKTKEYADNAVLTKTGERRRRRRTKERKEKETTDTKRGRRGNARQKIHAERKRRGQEQTESERRETRLERSGDRETEKTKTKIRGKKAVVGEQRVSRNDLVRQTEQRREWNYRTRRKDDCTVKSE